MGFLVNRYCVHITNSTSCIRIRRCPHDSTQLELMKSVEIVLVVGFVFKPRLQYN